MMRLRTSVLLIAGAAIGLAAEWLQFGWRDAWRWVPDLVVGWTFIGCGVVAMTKRPNTRSGGLMAATGFTWFMPNFAGLSGTLVSQAAANTVFWHRGPLVHLILTYPEGRTTSRFTRVAIALGYTAAVFYPISQSETGTIVMAASLLAASVLRYLASIGQARRAHRYGLVASIALTALLTGEAIVRSGAVSVESTVALLVYEVTLCAIAIGLMAGLLTAPWERAEVTDLVVELARARTGMLRDELSRALGDPTLEVGYWVPERARFVDAAGRGLTLPDGDSDRSRTLVERDGDPVAVIIHDPTVLGDPALIQAVASAAKLGASNARLQADVRARQLEVRESRQRIVEAADEARRRLELRLHDGAQRRLDVLAETLRSARGASDGSAFDPIVQAASQLDKTREDVQRLARGIHPRELSEHGLASALTTLKEDLSLPIELVVDGEPGTASVEACAYFVCSESLANVAKYARASAVRVLVHRIEDRVAVVVEDDGMGGADPAGSGLRGLADRVATLGGTFSVESPPGSGTRVTALIPVAADV